VTGAKAEPAADPAGVAADPVAADPVAADPVAADPVPPAPAGAVVVPAADGTAGATTVPGTGLGIDGISFRSSLGLPLQPKPWHPDVANNRTTEINRIIRAALYPATTEKSLVALGNFFGAAVT
jgi:hypothetical protein